MNSMISRHGKNASKKPVSNSSVKNVLFVDFNGVISYNPFWVTLKNTEHRLHAYHEAIENYLFKEHVSIVMDWMVGKYTSEEIHHLLEKEIGVPYNELFPIFRDECASMDISNKILERIGNLRQFYYCVLITDNMDSFDRFTLKHNPVLHNTFDRIDNSYSMKRYKKSDGGSYFIDMVKQRGALIEHCILIDDSINTCDLFKSIGGNAFATRTEEDVVAVLNEIKNLIQNTQRMMVKKE